MNETLKKLDELHNKLSEKIGESETSKQKRKRLKRERKRLCKGTLVWHSKFLGTVRKGEI